MPADTVNYRGAKTATRLTLTLGVLDQPYRSRGSKARSITTGEVAQILEDKYEIMQTFWNLYQKEIIGSLETGLQQSFEALLMGQHVNPWGSSTSQIQERFRNWISSYEAEKSIRGAPTLAAVMGVNHRLKHPYAKRNPRRPSFRDTGLYLTSFRAVVE